MRTDELLADGFGRVQGLVHRVLSGLPDELLGRRLDPGANSIAWLVWHLTRIQDDHVAAAFGVPQVWAEGGWAARFGLPTGSMEHGYGHNRVQVAAIGEACAESGLLTDYHEAVYAQTIKLISGVSDADLDRVVDASWRPPVTLGVRLVSVINDDAQHAGQAAFVRGLTERMG